ncbi:hypothetical protein FACS1894111_03240 [Clostridia bacterium]|nr:hypothetical protein FACS1894111_03240 [Clostridia bacterium]
MKPTDELRMTCSGLLLHNGEKTVRITFERGEGDFAEGILPKAAIEKSSGFDPEELTQLEQYLQVNCNEILKTASKVNPLRDWIKKK